MKKSCFVEREREREKRTEVSINKAKDYQHETSDPSSKAKEERANVINLPSSRPEFPRIISGGRVGR